MKKQTCLGTDVAGRFRREMKTLWPLAKGTLAEIRKPCIRAGCKTCASGKKHPALVYMFREKGRQRCMYVPGGLAGQLCQAIANWKRLEACSSALGREIILGYRLQRSALKSRKQ